MHAETDELAGRVGAIIDAGPDGDASAFDALALELFAFQFRHNAPFREYCEQKGIEPERVTDWSQVPAFPSDAFKADVVASFPPELAVLANLTSGTTANRRGAIFRDEAGRKLIFAANRTMTGAYLFPDFTQGQRCRILILAPSPQMAPSMGMAIGMDQTRIHFGTPDSEFLLDRSGIDVKRLVRALEDAESSGIPVAMIGSTSAFVYFLNACRARNLRFLLPPGSRIGDGGGYRGRFGEMSREDYYRLVAERLNIPRTHCVNVLGMAESATNYFEDQLRDTVFGRAPAPVPRRRPPPWTRVRAVSREDLSPLPPGEVGLLQHYDLANLPTVLGVQTDNLGYVNADGTFQIVGRAKVVDGKVTEMPSERVVGPMGDRRIFRFLEAYVNFSTRFKMGRLFAPRRRHAPAQYPPACPCSAEADEMVAATRPDGDGSKSNSG